MTSRTPAGIPAEAFEFFERLAADNTKAFWTAHQDDWRAQVRDPLVALCAALEPEFGAAHLFRPYRDVRFSKDKSPYKDHQGAFVELEDAVGYYLQLSAGGLMVAGGWYAPRGLQVHRYREAVDGPHGAALERALTAATTAGLVLDGDVMKTRPRGIAPDHPRVDLLRHRSLTLARTWEPAAWMGTRTVVTRVRDTWRAMAPALTWLADHVGPGDEPGPDGLA
jgi:uncharacterized protein (TIGR02453 family)